MIPNDTAATAAYLSKKRDVLALLDLIAGCVENHPSQPEGEADWGHVTNIAYVRARLIDAAVLFAVKRDGDVPGAVARIEEALRQPPEDVDQALIDAM